MVAETYIDDAIHSLQVAIADLSFAKRILGSRWPWDRDIASELSMNPGPYNNYYLNRDGGWWMRRLDQIDAITIHHTLSDSPHATAARYITKGGGRPSIPYTIWVSQTGEVLKCALLEWGLWHDHTGHMNTHLSIGMAGLLHLYRPVEVQMRATAKVCAWAIKSEELPQITETSQVRGHKDYIATICPGWSSEKSGNWKYDFFDILEEVVNEYPG